MDSKQRHEWEQNELAKWISAQYQDWIRPNSGWLGYAVLGVFIVIAIIIVTARVNTWNQNTAWKHYYAALNSANAESELEILANSTSGVTGTYARLALAQRQLAEGCSQVFIDKSRAIGLLEKAIASFQQVQKTANDPAILQQAVFGAGLAWETLAAARVGDDLAKAEEAYQQVIERWEDGLMGQRAHKQLALIQRQTTKNFIELSAKKVVEETESPELEGFRRTFGLEDPLAPPQINLDLLATETVPSEQKQEETETELPEPQM